MSLNKQYVLMVGGDEDDQYITTATLVELGYRTPVRFLSRSNQLIDYLSVNGEPMLILLDYNARPANAIELLKQLKVPGVQHIPVVVLADVASPEYVKECYELGAVSFIVKPAGATATKEKIATFFKYWFSVVEI
jgi:CheY-like chemotaxis protein